MSAIERMTIAVPADMAAALREAVAGGAYASINDVFREALQDWLEANDAELRGRADVRAAIHAGLHSGPAIPADEVFAELRARYAAKG